MNAKQLERAIQNVLDGTIDEASAKELAAQLKLDPAARETYYQQAELHQALSTRYSHGSASDTASIITRFRLRSQMRRSGILAILATAAVVVLSVIVLRSVFINEAEPLSTYEIADGSLITHIGSDGRSDVLQVGEVLELEQGAIELTFNQGSRALILAPASFRFASSHRLELTRGNGWFRIEEDDRGFKVVTPELEVTDLGTEFGIVSTPGSSDQIHVFKGSVIAKNLNAQKDEEQLTAGESRISAPDGQLTKTQNRPWEFLVRLPESASDGMIINGGFESGETPPDSQFGVTATASNLPGWRFGKQITVVRASAGGRPGYGTPGSTVLSSSSDTQVGFNVNGLLEAKEPDATIYQTFTTTPGREYQVQFEMGAFFASKNTVAVTASLREGVGLKGTIITQQTSQRLASDGNGYNAPSTFRFKAKSAKTTLVFTETSESTFRADPVIDNISIKPIY